MLTSKDGDGPSDAEDSKLISGGGSSATAGTSAKGLKHEHKMVLLLLWAGGSTFVLGLVACLMLTMVSTEAVGAGDFRNHIVFMPWAFVFSAPLGAIAWRIMPALGASRETTKKVHAFFMLEATVLASLGVIGIVKAHAEHYERETNAWGEAHFQSAHSWIGIVAFTIFFANALGGFGYFILGNKFGLATKETRANYMPIHAFFGFVAVGLTLLSVPMGIMAYAYRGTLEHGPPAGPGPNDSKPINGIKGAAWASMQYKLSALCIVGEIISVFLVFFVSKPLAKQAEIRDA